MIKKILVTVLCLFLLVSVLAGCQNEDDNGDITAREDDESSETTGNGEGLTEEGSDDRREDDQSEAENGRDEEADKRWAELDTKEVRELVSGVMELVFSIMELEVGGEPFVFEGNKYYFLPEPYDSKAEIEKQFSEFMTEDGTEKILEYLPIVEVGGRVGRQDMPTEPMPDFMESEVIFDESEGSTASYLLTIPINGGIAHLGVTITYEDDKLLLESIDFRRASEPSSSQR